jgi:hypothetical protein
VFHGDGASDAIDGWGDLWAPGWYGCGWGWGLGGYGGWGWYGYWGSSCCNAPAFKSGYLAKDVKVGGASWIRPCVTYAGSHDFGTDGSNCMCISSRMALDEFGRYSLRTDLGHRLEHASA